MLKYINNKKIYIVGGIGVFTLLSAIIIVRKNVSRRIAKTAYGYIGKLEHKGNSGFFDKEFDKKMRDIGFQTGFDWCILFVKLVAKQVIGESDVLNCINASTQNTWKKLQTCKKVQLVDKPIPGSIVFYQWQSKKTNGHAEIVYKVTSDGFISISGNSPSPDKKNQGVFLRERKFSEISTGDMRLLGYVKIK